VLQRIFAAGPACLLNGAAQAAGRFLIIGALLAQALLGTLKRADGIIQGWGKHYRFCNDQHCFEILDRKVDVLIREYLGFYGVERRRTDEGRASQMLGVERLAILERTPFEWPSTSLRDAA